MLTLNPPSIYEAGGGQQQAELPQRYPAASFSQRVAVSVSSLRLQIPFSTVNIPQENLRRGRLFIPRTQPAAVPLRCRRFATAHTSPGYHRAVLQNKTAFSTQTAVSSS